MARARNRSKLGSRCLEPEDVAPDGTEYGRDRLSGVVPYVEEARASMASIKDHPAIHVHDAHSAGASRDAIVETIGVAILVGGGPSVMYGVEALEALGQFEAKD